MARKRLKTLSDCRRFLAAVANQLDDNEIETDKARALGYIVSIMQKIIEGSDLEQRVAALEAEKNGRG